MNDHISAGSNIFNDYTIEKILGTGAYGEVHLCHHIKTNMKRAVKIIYKKNTDKNEIQKLIKEVEILKEMDH
jgi:calcium-dependent protein kinase